MTLASFPVAKYLLGDKVL